MKVPLIQHYGANAMRPEQRIELRDNAKHFSVLNSPEGRLDAK